jgi:ATP-dependent Clp protease ATP-binding subunit ClpA
MFERFSRDARDVVVASQEESRRLGHDRVGTVHLLLGMLGDEDGTAGQALRRHGVDLDRLRELVRHVVGAGRTPLDGDALAVIGIDLDAVRQAVEASFGEGALERGRSVKGHIPFTPQAKKSLELALRSALALKHKRICGGHLLLGVLRATGDDNLALQVLTEAQVDLAGLKATATELLRADAA